jgi:NAD(P)-dependent dehydrogenase (short-subunit alcohol dehydrogenase family)
LQRRLRRHRRSAVARPRREPEARDVHFERCDVRDIPALKRAIASIAAALGPITVLVNNAARDDRHAMMDVTVEYWDENQAVNLRHQVFATQAVVPMMEAGRQGLGHQPRIDLVDARAARQWSATRPRRPRSAD